MVKKHPTQEELLALLELSPENFQTYISRCLLRALPLTIGHNKFDYLNRTPDKKDIITSLIFKSIGFNISSYVGESVTNALNYAETAAYDEVDHKTATDPEADVDAISHAKNIIRENSNAYYLANISASEVTKRDIHKADILAELVDSDIAYVDYLSLSKGDSLEGKPLWREASYPPFWERKYNDWCASLDELGLGKYADNFHKLLAGNHNPKQLYQPLYNEWIVNKKKFGKAKQLDYPQDSNHESIVVDLSGSLSINAEKPGTDDTLGRERLVDSIAELLNHPNQVDPLTIGLLGDWGAGKTTVLNLLEQALTKNKQKSVGFEKIKEWLKLLKTSPNKDNKQKPVGFERVKEWLKLLKTSLNKDNKKTVNYTVETFNAWSYEHTESIQAGVAQSAIVGLNKTKRGWLKWLQRAWLSLCLQFKLAPLKTIGYTLAVGTWFSGIYYLAEAGRLKTVWEIGFGATLTLLFLFAALKPFFAHPVTKEFISFFQLPDFTSDTGKLPIYQLQVKELSKLCLHENERMLFVVDDLDRCSPEGIVKVFEAIRLVMELNNVTVIIAIDHRIALSALAHHYQALEDQGSPRTKYDVARDYLGKIIQLPVNLDRPNEVMVDQYVASLFVGNMADQERRHTNEKGSPSSTGQVEHIKPAKSDDDNIDNLIAMTHEEHQVIKTTTETTMRHSQAEKQRFTELTHLLGFHNPRQLKRLHSSYRLLRAYSKAGEGQNLKYLCGLFFLEYCYNQKEEEVQIHENKLFDFLKNRNNPASDAFAYLGDCFANEKEYLSAIKVVKPFVLPQIEISRS